MDSLSGPSLAACSRNTRTVSYAGAVRVALRRRRPADYEASGLEVADPGGLEWGDGVENPMMSLLAVITMCMPAHAAATPMDLARARRRCERASAAAQHLSSRPGGMTMPHCPPLPASIMKAATGSAASPSTCWAAPAARQDRQ